MKKARTKWIILGAALLLLLGIAVYAASNYGTQDDPLITKSYLDGVVQPELDKALREQLEQALAEADTGGGDFTLLTLQSGQRVTGMVGTELILRFGSARAYAYDSADVALVDTTDAKTLMNGTALTANHLYMITIRDNGFTAASNNTKILISGDYTIQ